MKKQEIYCTVDRYGNIKKDKFSTFINNYTWITPTVFIIVVLIGAWVEGNM